MTAVTSDDCGDNGSIYIQTSNLIEFLLIPLPQFLVLKEQIFIVIQHLFRVLGVQLREINDLRSPCCFHNLELLEDLGFQSCTAISSRVLAT
jgi:hypothetical protein